MKNRKFALVVVSLVILIGVAVWFTQRKHPGAQAVQAKPFPSKQLAPLIVRGEEDSAETVSPITPAAPAKEIEEKKYLIRADQVLATVNGVNIVGKDLMAFNSKDYYSTLSLSDTLYQYLLNRAIERELTFQEAKAKGITLNADQLQQLRDIRLLFQTRDHDARSPSKVIGRLNVGGASPQDQAEFDSRDASGFLLQNSLMEAAGAAPPYVTDAQVEEYYKSHISQYGALPATPNERTTAWQRIETTIRQELARSTRQAYQDGLRQYIEQLKSSAKITVNEPTLG